jgi:putative peptide zinc metalloprotease protein
MKLRTRTDLQFFPVTGYREATWVVRDPLTTTCYYLGDEEVFLLQELNQVTSLSELQTRFEQEFAPRPLPMDSLQALLADWVSKQLLLADPGQQGPLMEQSGRGEQAGRRGGVWGSLLKNPLAIRFRGWNPQRFLEALLPWCAVLFSPVFLGLSCLMMLVAAGLGVSRLPLIVDQLRQLPLLFGPALILPVLVCIAITKVLHELGHALTCHRFGGRCHEMGVLLLVGIPCLYCNVTDAWTFPSRRQRVAVSAAGIFVDLWIASFCLLIWLATEPGWLNSVCLLLAVLGSLNSLLLNGNPLMRYDGYYIFGDLLGMANFRSQAMRQARLIGWRVLLGPLPAPSERPAWGMASYGVLAGLYLWAVLFLILSAVYHGLKPWGAEVFAVLLGGMIVPTQLAMIGRVGWREGQMEYQRRGRPRGRLRYRALLLTVCLLALLLTPFPRRIPAWGILRPAGGQLLTNIQAGTLQDWTVAGATLQPGQMIFRLSDPGLEQDLAELATQAQALEAYELAVQRKRTQLSDSSETLALLAERKQALQAQQQRLEQQQADLIRDAPHSGEWLVDPLLTANLRTTEQPGWWEPFWCAVPAGKMLPQGTPLGILAVSQPPEVLISIEQHWADLLTPGAQVVLFLPEAGLLLPEATLQRVATTTHAAHRSLAAQELQEAAGQILQQQIRSFPGQNPAQQIVAVASISQPEAAGWTCYQPCRVRISVPAASLWQRLTEFLQRTWNPTL